MCAIFTQIQFRTRTLLDHVHLLRQFEMIVLRSVAAAEQSSSTQSWYTNKRAHFEVSEIHYVLTIITLIISFNSNRLQQHRKLVVTSMPLHDWNMLHIHIYFCVSMLAQHCYFHYWSDKYKQRLDLLVPILLGFILKLAVSEMRILNLVQQNKLNAVHENQFEFFIQHIE